MILYFFLSSFSLLLLFGLYHFVLKGTKQFHFNRFYLLGALTFSLVVPAIEWNSAFLPESIEQTYLELNELSQNHFNTQQQEIILGEPIHQKNHLLQDTAVSIYLLVCSILLLRLFFHFFYLVKLTNNSGPVIHGMKSVLMNRKTQAFSFFHYLFIQEDQLEQIRNNTAIIQHEKAHALQKHSLDILWIELIHCFFWFNPIIIGYKKAITANHEFLADEYASSFQKNKQEYLLNLLHHVQPQKPNSLTSGFGYLIIKKRIKMIQQLKPSKMKTTLSTVISILFFISIISFSAFKPADSKELSLIESENTMLVKSENTPSILPIKKESITKISSSYGMRTHPVSQEKVMHTGVDIIAPKGTPILATADGTVHEAAYSPGYGQHVKIKHDKSYTTLYAHMENFTVKPGQKVKAGEVIGVIGNTGKSIKTHLHYEVIKDGEKVNPSQFFNYKTKPQ